MAARQRSSFAEALLRGCPFVSISLAAIGLCENHKGDETVISRHS